MAATYQPPLKGRDPASSQDELNTRIRNHYDRYADIYDLYQFYSHDWFQQRAWWHEAISIRKTIGRKPLRVLDVGCGTGNLALKFKSMGCDVVGVDISRRALEMLQRKAETTPKGRLSLVTADILDFLASARPGFDVVCECSALHHIFDYEPVVRLMARKVNPGGMLFITRELLSPQEIRRLDPFRGAIASGLERAYRYIHRRMSKAFMLSHVIPPPDLSRISANFYENGISLDRVRAVIASEGLTEISLRRFNEREAGILSWLDNSVFRAFRRERFQKSFYSLIAQRPAAST